MSRKTILFIGGGFIALVAAVIGLWFVRYRSVEKEIPIVITSTTSTIIQFTTTTKITTGQIPEKEIAALVEAGQRMIVQDADQDGLTIEQEKQAGTDPKKQDTDGDGLTDGEEYLILKTNPIILNIDTEIQAAIDAMEPSPIKDLMKANHPPRVIEAPVEMPKLQIDSDSDDLTDLEEQVLGTDPNKADTDGDGLTDSDEIKKYRTNPLKVDTDGDSYPDAEEIKNGYNPLGSGKCLTKTCSL